MKKLSIIIPYYNTKTEYTDELLDVLAPQMTDEVECVVVDDGSKIPYKTKHKWCRVIYQKNGGTSVARNTGIDNTTGEYISFIDSDDLVANYFIKKILNKIETEHFDFMEMSWKCLPGGKQVTQKLCSIKDKLPNPSVCHRIFKRSFIGNLRFNPTKMSGEDEEFSRKIGYERGKRSVETEFMCFYRTAVENSKSKRFIRGEVDGTKIIVYSYPRITKDMKWLVDEVRKEDKRNQVFVLTDYCELTEELKPHARIYCPQKRIEGHELRGEYSKYFVQLVHPINVDIVLYISKIKAVSGIGTFLYNYCKKMHKYYRLAVLYDYADISQIKRLTPYATVVSNKGNLKVDCSTLIMNSIMDKIPRNVSYKQSVQIIHACSDVTTSKIPQDRDRIVYVSEVAKNSWGMEGEVIGNMALPDSSNPLLLVTASRFDSSEKGQKRIVRLARLMNEKEIPFVWLYFSNETLTGAPPNLIKLPPTTDVRGYIKKADYLVQLSDSEGFCYSIVEALTDGVPVITTPLPVLKEIGVNDKNSHIVPFDIPDDYDVQKIFSDRKRGFKYIRNNDLLKKKWDGILTNIPEKEYVMVEIIQSYHDIKLGRDVKKGEVLQMEKKRAHVVKDAGKCKIR
jgi:glycosyltransferase involved in cell wall biosynthesis